MYQLSVLGNGHPTHVLRSVHTLSIGILPEQILFIGIALGHALCIGIVLVHILCIGIVLVHTLFIGQLSCEQCM